MTTFESGDAASAAAGGDAGADSLAAAGGVVAAGGSGDGDGVAMTGVRGAGRCLGGTCAFGGTDFTAGAGVVGEAFSGGGGGGIASSVAVSGGSSGTIDGVNAIGHNDHARCSSSDSMSATT